MKKALLIFTLGILTFMVVNAWSDTPISTLTKGSPIPAATLSDLNGTPFQLQNVHPPVLVTIFTSWCAICKKELTQLNVDYPAIQQKNINVIAVNAGEKLATVKKYVNRMHMSYPVYVDTDLNLIKSLKITGTPGILLFNKEGKLVYQGNELPNQWTDLVK